MKYDVKDIPIPKIVKIVKIPSLVLLHCAFTMYKPKVHRIVNGEVYV